ncbi:MAG: hypothetical protein ACREIT_10610 [Tepidisphaeraceae bacterium]
MPTFHLHLNRLGPIDHQRVIAGGRVWHMGCTSLKAMVVAGWPHDRTARGTFHPMEDVMRKLWLFLLMLAFAGTPMMMGCEASAEIDDDDGEIELDVDD